MADSEGNSSESGGSRISVISHEDEAEIKELLQTRKSLKENLEEIKRKGREERIKKREEERKKREEKMTESDGSDQEMEYYVRQLSAMSISVQKPQKWLGTGFIYDEVMLKHKNDWDPNFPEKPERISGPFKRCAELGLLERCTRIEKQYGTEDMVLLQHTQELLEKVKSTSEMTKAERKTFSQQYDSLYCNQDTYEVALVALGCVVELMEHILKQKVTNGLALIRPPGHHSMSNTLCGFCIFNNVAIAAKHAVDTLGVKKVLIVDWDVHHGQATQQMFYNDPRVLYLSIHRYEYGKYWPHLRESDYDFIGEDKGLGYNINVPLNKTGMTDSDYLAIFNQILLPVAYEFSPDLVLVSAGYDCAIGCPEGEMMVSPACFGHMTRQLMSLADGRVCVCLEGGYCIKSLSESVALTLKSLMKDPCPLLGRQGEPSESVTESILNVIKVLKPYWSCFQYQDLVDDDDSEAVCLMKGVDCMPPRPGIKFMTEENSPKVFPLTYTYPEEVKEVYLHQKKFDPILDRLKAETVLLKPPYRTCIVYDDAMRAHRSESSHHPEDPDRITKIFDKHVEWGLVDRCLRIQSRMATEGELQLIHSSKYVEEMKSTQEMTISDLRTLQYSYNSIYMNPDTYNCALLATGSLLNVVHTVMTGQASSGIAVVRPPGHHAEDTKCMGFCFFNSVAIAAKYAQEKFGLKRVMILDWDVHHGNGTQHQLYEDDSVLLINLHRYDNGGFYPMSTDGSEEMVGEGHGKGYNVNIAWNYGRMGDAEYIAAFHHIVMPIAYQFAPELVLVSAGFDSAIGDPLGGYMISPLGYSHMTHMLSTLANGRVILSLEGGYNLCSISHSMSMCTSILLGDPCPALQVSKPMDSAIKTIKTVIDVHKQYWSCLKFRVQIPDITQKEDAPKGSGKVDDTVQSGASRNGDSTKNSGVIEINTKSTDNHEEITNEKVPVLKTESNNDAFKQVTDDSLEKMSDNNSRQADQKLAESGTTSELLDPGPDSIKLNQTDSQGNEDASKLDQAVGGQANGEEEIEQLTEAASSLTLEGIEVFNDTVTIYIDEHPGINFLRLLRGKQKSLEAETKSKIFLRGQALETRGLETPEKVLFIHVFSNNKENVTMAVEKIKEIKDIEIRKLQQSTEQDDETSANGSAVS